jgi:hypothetical protein
MCGVWCAGDSTYRHLIFPHREFAVYIYIHIYIVLSQLRLEAHTLKASKASSHRHPTAACRKGPVGLRHLQALNLQALNLQALNLQALKLKGCHARCMRSQHHHKFAQQAAAATGPSSAGTCPYQSQCLPYGSQCLPYGSQCLLNIKACLPACSACLMRA